MAWRFEPGEQLGDAFRRVATEEIAKVRAGLADPGKDKARAIHEARQGFKRLRALARLAELSLGEDFREENRRWRDIGRRLSGSRDQTVVMESFDTIVAECPDGLAQSEVAHLRSVLAASGAEHQVANADDAVREVIALLDEAENRMPELSWPRSVKALAKALKRSQKVLRRQWRAARKANDPLALHEWRKRVKDQAAQLRLFRGVAPSSLLSRHGDEKKTAELLGEEHDCWLLRERLCSCGFEGAAAECCDVLLDRIRARRKALRNEALKIGREFSSEEPRAFSRSLIAAWEEAAARAKDKSATSPAS